MGFLGVSLLLLFMSGVIVTSVHINVYVVGGGGGSLLPLFMLMYMC
jgi:hypothetical protein